MLNYDVAIVGGGLAGLSLAILLKNSGFRLALIDEQAPSVAMDHNFSRPLSINYGSYRILGKAQLHQVINPFLTPIKKVYVSEKYGLGSVIFNADDYHIPALGYVAPVAEFASIFRQLVSSQRNVDSFYCSKVTQINTHDSGVVLTVCSDAATQSISAKLVVGADGSRSLLRQLLNISTTDTPCHEQAIVATIACARHHNYVAYERFTPEGTLAILPMDEHSAYVSGAFAALRTHGHQVGLVWTLPQVRAMYYLELADAQFLQKVQEQLGYHLGKFHCISKRQTVPLHLVHAHEQILPHAVLIGNAAHTLHPIAAQGFNLGLHDAACLADLLMHRGISLSTLQQYQSMRLPQQQRIMGLSKSLHAICSSSHFVVKRMRRVGLSAMSLCPTSRDWLARCVVGFDESIVVN